MDSGGCYKRLLLSEYKHLDEELVIKIPYLLDHLKSLDYSLNTNLYNLCETLKPHLFLVTESTHIIASSAINFPVDLK